jgi:hypothetical protein
MSEGKMKERELDPRIEAKIREALIGVGAFPAIELAQRMCVLCDFVLGLCEEECVKESDKTPPEAWNRDCHGLLKVHERIRALRDT